MRTVPPQPRTTNRSPAAGQRTGGRLQKAVQEEIALEHLHLAEAIAHGFCAFKHDAADVRQVAYVGLIKAARRFDPDIGVEFAAYAVPTIRGEVKRYLRDSCWVIRPPREIQDLKAQAAKAAPALAQRLGREPSVAELAEHLGRDSAAVAEALACGGSQRPESLDASPGGLGWADTLPSGEDEYARSDEVMALRAAVRELSAPERELLYRRYFHEETQDRIALRLGMTQMQISRMLARTLVKLQKRLLEGADGPAMPLTRSVLETAKATRATRIA